MQRMFEIYHMRTKSMACPPLLLRLKQAVSVGQFRFRLFSFLLCGMLLLNVGCQSKTNDSGSSKTKGKQKAEELGPAPPGQTEPPLEGETLTPAAVQLTVADWKQVQEFVKSQSGKVVVVDIWALTCLPCRREYPHLVELQNSHRDDVVCVSVCCDYVGAEDQPVEFYEERARKFLAKRNATFQHFLMKTPQSEFYKSINVAGIPVLFVFDQNGNLSRRFSNDIPEFQETGFTYKDHVLPLIAKLTKKTSDK